MSGPGVAGRTCVGADGTGMSLINSSACFQDNPITKSGLEVSGCDEKRELGTPFVADCGTMREENEICCCYSDHSTALFRPALSAAETGQLCSSACFHNAALNTVFI